jgi:hypothetical protein
MKIDHLHPGEKPPVFTGFLTLDPDYTWVVRNDDGSIALAVTGGRLHDVVIINKPHGYDVIPVDAIHQVFRTMRDECLARGIRAFLIWHDPTWTGADLTFYKFLEPYIDSRVKFNGEILCGLLSSMNGLGERGH